MWNDIRIIRLSEVRILILEGKIVKIGVHFS